MHQDLAYYRTMQLAGLIKNAALDGTEISEDSTMIAVYPPADFAEKVKPHAAEDQRDKLHVTVIYLGHTTPEQAELAGTILEKVTARHGPIELSVNGAGVFYNPEGAVRQLLINGPGLNNFREDLFNALDDAGLMPEQKYGYIPHMTLEYHKDGQMPERWELVGKGSYPAWEATEVCLVRGDKEEKACQLTAEKTAAPSSYFQDFMAGMDPFGAWTNQYGMEAQRAGLSEGEHALKRGIGTAGGVLGGAALVPSAIFGATEAAKGFAGGGGSLRQRLGRAAAEGAKGFVRPIKSVLEGRKASRGLKRVAEGGAGLTGREQQAIRYLGEGVGLTPEMLQRVQRTGREVAQSGSATAGQRAAGAAASAGAGAARRVSPQQVTRFSETSAGREAARQFQPVVQDQLSSGKAQLGLGGLIGGGGAYYQYGSGRETERQTTPMARARRTLMGE